MNSYWQSFLPIINHLIDSTTPEKLDKAINAIAGMSEDDFERAQLLHSRKMAKVRDKEAFDSEMGIERITVFLKHGSSIPLIKPRTLTFVNSHHAYTASESKVSSTSSSFEVRETIAGGQDVRYHQVTHQKTKD